MSELLPCPHVGVDDQGFAVLEWWHGDRKLTVYTNDGICLKVWGPNIDSEMEEVDVADPAQVRSAFAWLSGSTPASSSIDSSSAYSSPIGADPAIEVGGTFNRRLDAVRVEDYERAIADIKWLPSGYCTPDYIGGWLSGRARAIARQRGESNGGS